MTDDPMPAAQFIALCKLQAAHIAGYEWVRSAALHIPDAWGVLHACHVKHYVEKLGEHSGVMWKLRERGMVALEAERMRRSEASLKPGRGRGKYKIVKVAVDNAEDR